ncbi:MAG: AGE family epimerase/isomerase, partial [Candidatus Sumerlaeota bacterium]
MDTESGGFFSYLGYSGKPVHTSKYKSLMIQSRILYNFAEGLRFGMDFAARGAEHAYACIAGKMKTEEGWYTSLYGDARVHPEVLDTYDNMFAILGLARYAEATGNAEIMQEAVRLFRQVEELTLIGDDPSEGLIGRVNPSGRKSDSPFRHYHRRSSRSGSNKSRYKIYTGNSNLHYLEAMAVLDHAFRARPEFSGLRLDFTERVKDLREFFLRYIFDEKRHITFDHFRESFSEPFDMPGASVSLAHGLEWVGFFRAFDGLQLPENIERALLEKSRIEGLREDGLFEDYFYLAEERTAGGGMFWPQVEAALTYNIMAPIYGEPYYEAFRKTATYYFEHFIDPEGGVHM